MTYGPPHPGPGDTVTAPATPPAGPGVQPPFAAPPIDGDRTRVWVGFGVGAAALLLCCVGGVAGFGGLMVTGVRAVNEQAQATVRNYLDALSEERFDEAYGLLCDSAQDDESPQEFADRVSDEPQVSEFTVGQAEITDEVVVPADVRYATGSQRELLFRLEQDSGTGQFEVCGVQ